MILRLVIIITEVSNQLTILKNINRMKIHQLLFVMLLNKKKYCNWDMTSYVDDVVRNNFV